MNRPLLQVIEGGGERERLTEQLLEDISRMEWNEERISQLVARLQASPKPMLKLAASNAGKTLSASTPEASGVMEGARDE